jgi:hypothetical protein
VAGHERCFHRRDKAYTSLIYRAALLLRTDGGYDLGPGDDAVLTVGNWWNNQHCEEMGQIVDVIAGCCHALPPGPPRCFGVRFATHGWIALSTDGWVATASAGRAANLASATVTRTRDN